MLTDSPRSCALTELRSDSPDQSSAASGRAAMPGTVHIVRRHVGDYGGIRGAGPARLSGDAASLQQSGGVASGQVCCFCGCSPSYCIIFTKYLEFFIFIYAKSQKGRKLVTTETRCLLFFYFRYLTIYLKSYFQFWSWTVLKQSPFEKSDMIRSADSPWKRFVPSCWVLSSNLYHLIFNLKSQPNKSLRF